MMKKNLMLIAVASAGIVMAVSCGEKKQEASIVVKEQAQRSEKVRTVILVEQVIDREVEYPANVK
ncbi:MAG: hypothetical protein LBC49_00275, partial [Bacteroidales bacterium]|nr:hypothetical protein [Bacteroidales bacterium]